MGLEYTVPFAILGTVFSFVVAAVCLRSSRLYPRCCCQPLVPVAAVTASFGPGLRSPSNENLGVGSEDAYVWIHGPLSHGNPAVSPV